MSADSQALQFHIERHGLVGSTNDLARAAAERGEPEGLWVLADAQAAGRGRHGRRWASAPGNFYGSLLLRPRLPLARAASLSLLTGLVVAETVTGLAAGRVDVSVKWPNDVLVGRAKIAGILLEGAAAADGESLWVVVGLGANLVAHPKDTPYPTSSLKALGLSVTPDGFLEALMPRLEARLRLWRTQGFAGLRDSWLARAVGIGEPVRIVAGGETVAGRMLDLDDQGALRLVTDAGEIRRFEAGELFFG
ncbi:biotin--[acetyl-CoA-carboxylase] ligase [Marinimicrococcus flavescens]|uniref:biotin--[biotin carboxyl-carrier protein] ligase n=1 Tax=Marinimicrococcus flavescens TaxID=3031815 RepID=A0AAP3UZY1_9PROT|nr:biotin--[acetyl-CoA-carboxylase] ligase [Marinimicrococcus flavescens]